MDINKKQGNKTESILFSVKHGVLEWLYSLNFKDAHILSYRWKYSSSMMRPYGLIPTAQAVIIIGMFDELKNIPDKEKNLIINYLQSEQDIDDGFFKDSLITDNDIVKNNVHSDKDIWGQMTGVSVQALRLLNAKPKYPLPKSFYINIDDCNKIKENLKNWNWANPWHTGERFSRTLQALQLSGNQKSINDAFDFYEQEVLDNATGMPMNLGCSHSLVAAAGLFKILIAYRHFSRLYPAAEKAIDFILKLQNANGEFANDMCLNWDCVWVLRELDNMLAKQYRHDCIVKSSIKLSNFLLKEYRKKDGGFSFFREFSAGDHHSVNIGERKAISDTMGTSMILRCLFYSDEFLESIDETIQSRIKFAHSISN